VRLACPKAPVPTISLRYTFATLVRQQGGEWPSEIGLEGLVQECDALIRVKRGEMHTRGPTATQTFFVYTFHKNSNLTKPLSTIFQNEIHLQAMFPYAVLLEEALSRRNLRKRKKEA
jgi:hypothetical protein